MFLLQNMLHPCSKFKIPGIQKRFRIAVLAIESMAYVGEFDIATGQMSFIVDWCSGSMTDSNSVDEGSIPSLTVLTKKY